VEDGVDRAVREAVVKVGQTVEVDVGERRWCGETGEVGGGERESFVAAICVRSDARRRRRSVAK
jgi:hypothetical protein